VYGTDAYEARQFEGLMLGIARDGLAQYAKNWELKQEIEQLKRELELKDTELDLKDEKIAELSLELKKAQMASPGSEASYDPDALGEEY
jgi:hypothetical protein